MFIDKVSPLVLHPASWILPSTEVEVEVEVIRPGNLILLVR